MYTENGGFAQIYKILFRARYVLTEAVGQRCSVKKLFLKISQNLQENTCARSPVTSLK